MGVNTTLTKGDSERQVESQDKLMKVFKMRLLDSIIELNESNVKSK